MQNYFLLIFLSFNFLFLNLPRASGQTMSNGNYVIKTQGLNVVSGTVSGSDFKIKTNISELNPVGSTGVNFKVKTGFGNAQPVLPFSISLSSDVVNFGTLSPTNPIVRTVNLNVQGPLSGYSVVAIENHLPLASDGSFIPRTTCDNGMCGVESASEWINTLTYGFGYRCDNTKDADCDDSFKKSNFYRHFPDAGSNTELEQSIMEGIGSNNKEVRISYKVNVSGTQAKGPYSNTITYIAVPNF